MEKLIVPSIIASNQSELDQRLEKVKHIGKVIHFDIMDGKFVKNHSLDFEFKLPKLKQRIEMHLMVKNPMKFIKSNLQNAKTFIFQVESAKTKQEFKEMLGFLKKNRKEAGIALKPETKLSEIAEHLDDVCQVVILTGVPGAYGASFDSSQLSKVSKLKQFNPKLKVEVDIGINPSTISDAGKAGADLFVCGSFLQRSSDVRKAFAALNEKIKPPKK